jgi:DNA-directed RNA polymerase subunit H (RpoH/RPB5)
MEVKEKVVDPLVVVVVPEDQVVDNQDNKVVLEQVMIQQFLPH